jgi:DNA-binding CsgD family transcriptional regulator
MVNAHVKPALDVLDEGIAVSEEQELRFQLNCLRPGRAEALTFLGRWDEAATELSAVLVDPWAAPINRAIVLPGLARIRARRGDPGAEDALDEAYDLVWDMEEAQLYVPVRLVQAERAWLAGDLPRAREAIEACLPHVDVLDLAAERELYLWTTRTGVDWAPPDVERDAVLGALASGDHRARADWWFSRDCLYEGADALVDSDDPEDVRRGLVILTDLGARPRATMATRKLKELGVRDVPRGPRASTRANPAGLTAREVEVASLLAQGLTNAEIAERLVLSAKTVDHHTSAVLTKLGVSSRRHVGPAATELGLDLGTPVGGA